MKLKSGDGLCDALPTGRIDGPEESCGRAVQFWLRAGEIHNRFCGLMCQKFFDEFWRRVAATESPLYGTSTAYRLRRRISRTKFGGSGARFIRFASHGSATELLSESQLHPRTPELLDCAPFTP